MKQISRLRLQVKLQNSSTPAPKPCAHRISLYASAYLAPVFFADPTEKSARTQKEFAEHLRAHRPPPMRIRVLHIETSAVPTKHPRLIQIPFYSGPIEAREDKYKPSNTLKFVHQGLIEPGQLFAGKDGKTLRFVVVVGEAGAGKSTLSARLCDDTTRHVLHSTFMQMNYGEQHLNVKEILLQHFYNLEESKADEYFRWMVANQRCCRIVLDGYDQASWKIGESHPKLSFESKGKVEDVMGNLLQGHLLPNVQLVVTSRPHSILSLPPDLRPDRVVMLNGFSPQDAKELFVYFVGNDGEQKWSELEASAPQLCLMCSNPAMLTYIASSRSGDDDVSSLQTITSVLKAVLSDIKHSENTRQSGIDGIIDRVKTVAFNATRRESVVITKDDLNEVKLEIKDVEDLTVVFPAPLNAANGRLFDGESKLYFNHQTLQEYFSACYVAEKTAPGEFKRFVKNDLFKPHWSMVRRFLAGLLIGCSEGK